MQRKKCAALDVIFPFDPTYHICISCMTRLSGSFVKDAARIFSRKFIWGRNGSFNIGWDGTEVECHNFLFRVSFFGLLVYWSIGPILVWFLSRLRSFDICLTKMLFRYKSLASLLVCVEAVAASYSSDVKVSQRDFSSRQTTSLGAITVRSAEQKRGVPNFKPNLECTHHYADRKSTFSFLGLRSGLRIINSPIHTSDIEFQCKISFLLPRFKRY